MMIRPRLSLWMTSIYTTASNNLYKMKRKLKLMVPKDWILLSRDQPLIYFAQNRKKKIGNIVKSTKKTKKLIE